MLKFPFMRFHPFRSGVALAVTNAVFTIALGIVAGFFRLGTEVVRVLRSLYWGYDTTIVGVLLGAFSALLLGFAIGWFFGAVFNFFSYVDEAANYD